LQGVAENLKSLQEKNTAKSIDQSLMNVNPEDLEAKAIEELDELSQKVYRLEDLEKSILLKEHITLFKDNHLGSQNNPSNNI
jgi:hypothetical protein